MNQRFFRFILIFLLVTGVVRASDYSYLYKNLPFEMPVLEKPTFPDNRVSVADFGGIPDGTFLNTDAFAKAMDALAAKGGGTLVVPIGIWYTGPIVLQSNINLHLEEGALILFTSDTDQYPVIKTSYEGLESLRCQAPISGMNLTNIAITGKGSINGSGEAWRPLKKDKVTARHWDNVVKSGGAVKNGNIWYPSAGALKGSELSEMNVARKPETEAQWQDAKDFLRPVMVSLVGCKNVLLEDVLFENSPNWNVHPLMCENVIIDNVFIRNPGYAQNGDGLDLESCKNAIIVNSTFDVGDDAICLKSGKDEEGRKRGMATENVIVDNCKVFQGHGGFVVGSEMSGGVKNVSVKNCQFLGTDVGLRFKSTRGRGGIVENIYVENLTMFNLATEALLFDLYYGRKVSPEMIAEEEAKPVPAADDTTPAFRNIYIKDVIARNARRAMYFNGIPEQNIDNINIENVSISATYGAELYESSNITFKNVRITPTEGPALLARNVKNLNVVSLDFPDTLQKAVRLSGAKLQNIQLPESISEDRIEKIK